MGKKTFSPQSWTKANSNAVASLSYKAARLFDV